MNKAYDEVIAALERPEAYPECPASIEHLQTHISHLFLTPDTVYKVKKPVNFGFLDFTTYEQRLEDCRRELQLNRRLSPDVYLDVVAITRDAAGIHVGGESEAIEHAVKMRRLPAAATMSTLLAENRVTEDMVRDLARQVAAFHQQAETSPTIAAYGSPDVVALPVRENFAQTEAYRRRTILPYKWRDIRVWSERFLEEQRPLLQRRRDGGHIRDCHGDLHTHQVFYTAGGVRIIDCIEFNDRLRCCDVASDMAFMAMDLDASGRHDLSRLFVDTWLELTGDREALQVLDFYKVYRAVVRGKVESFRLEDATLPDEERDGVMLRARQYFNLAFHYIQRPSPPRLVICCGLIGSGKSTIARYTANDAGMGVVATDVVRKRLAGARPTERHYAEFGGGIYTPEFSTRTYQEQLRLSRQYLEEGRSVVLDATFGKRANREAAAMLAAELGAEFWAIECVADESDLQERLRRREARGESVSDGRWEIYLKERDAFEPLTEVPSDRHIVVRTTGKPVRESIAFTLQRLGMYRSWR